MAIFFADADVCGQRGYCKDNFLPHAAARLRLSRDGRGGRRHMFVDGQRATVPKAPAETNFLTSSKLLKVLVSRFVCKKFHP
jgi:hypothetical protein